MNFHFVYHKLRTGGIENYIVNLSEELLKYNHKVCLELISADGHDKHLVEGLVKSGIEINIRESHSLHWLLVALWGRNQLPEDIVIVSFDWQSFCYVNSVYGPGRRHVTGSYHIDEWNFSRWFFSRRLSEYILRKLPGTNFFVMNEYMSSFYSSRGINDPVLVPVGIRYPMLLNRRINFQQESIHIGLVARIVGWKSFLYQVVNFLSDSDLDFHLHIIGDGMDLAEYKKFVFSKIRLENVSFYGSLDLKSLYQLLLNIDCAVSVGTSAPLIASMGIPVVIGKENSPFNEDVNYGWFCDTTGYTYQEADAKLEEYSYSIIGDLLQIKKEEIIKLKNNHINRSLDFDIKTTAKSFISASIKSKNLRIFRGVTNLFIIIFFINRLGPSKCQYWTRRIRQ